MIEDEPVEVLARLGGRGIFTPSPTHENPFSLPSPVESFGFHETRRRDAQSRRDEIRHLTLLQRTDAIKSRPTPSIVHGNRPETAISAPGQSMVSLDARLRREKSQRIADFIKQKRDIFMVQMLIDMKNYEIAKVHNSMSKAEANLIATEAEISKTAVQYKMDGAKSEALLTKGRKSLESATHHRVTVVQSLKRATMSVSLMKSEIIKRKELLEGFHQFNEFLLSLLPEGQTIEEYFTDPRVAVEALDEMERESYFMIDRCETLRDRIDRAGGALQSEIKDTNVTISELDLSFDKFVRECAVDETQYLFTGRKTSDRLDSELERMDAIVKDTYLKCFDKEANVTTLAMLERIENTLEQYYRQVVRVDPAFIAEKQAIRFKERREEQRRLKQEKQEQDQLRKREHAAERANKPIKLKTGRPLVPRTALAKKAKTDDERLNAIRREQQRMENLLYGIITD
jgi:hypothetical protein